MVSRWVDGADVRDDTEMSVPCGVAVDKDRAATTGPDPPRGTTQASAPAGNGMVRVVPAGTVIVTVAGAWPGT